MPNVNCAAVMASLVVASTNLFNALAFAHQNRDRHHGHHHKNQNKNRTTKVINGDTIKPTKKHFKNIANTTITRPSIVKQSVDL